MSALVTVSAALFAAAEVLIVAVIGWDALTIAGAWGLVAVLVVAVALLVRNAAARVVLSVLLVGVCVLLTAELGQFFLPAAGALVAAAVSAGRHVAIGHEGR
jgi:hypothetical protein